MNYALIQASPASASSPAPPRRASPPVDPPSARAIPEPRVNEIHKFVRHRSIGWYGQVLVVIGSPDRLRVPRAPRAKTVRLALRQRGTRPRASPCASPRRHISQQSRPEPPKRLFNASQDTAIVGRCGRARAPRAPWSFGATVTLVGARRARTRASSHHPSRVALAHLCLARASPTRRRVRAPPGPPPPPLSRTPRRASTRR